MRRLVFSRKSIDDLFDIQDFIARDNPDRAFDFTQALREQCSRLASLPGTLGRPRPELQTGLRSFAFRGYVIFFRYSADRRHVMRIYEGHRDFPARFSGEGASTE